MKGEFTLTLDGIDYTVSADGDTIIVNDRAFTVEVLDNDSVLVDGIAYDAAVEGEVAKLGGESHQMAVSGLAMSAGPPAARAGSVAPTPEHAAAGAVLAIMPGKIIRVFVKVGQEVEEGDPICVLEAMKMENELDARQGGVVHTVHVQPGDDVEKDQVLVEIE
jgi:biotin carboxyl carrier protein